MRTDRRAFAIAGPRATPVAQRSGAAGFFSDHGRATAHGRLPPAIEWFLALATAPVWFPLLLASGFQTWLLPSELWLRYDLFRRGRYVSLRQLRDHSRAGHGTIIHDVASHNGGYVRVWWTEDDVEALAPVPPPSREERFGLPGDPFVWHPFDRWLWAQYLDLQHGTARMVGIMGGRNDETGLRRRFRGCKLVASFSGGRESKQIE